MSLSSLQWTMRTQVMLALSTGKTFAVYAQRVTVCPKEFDSTTLSHVRSLAQRQNFYTFWIM